MFNQTYRYEKVKRIFQRFDVNGDGGLNTEEFADFIVFTNPQYINYNEDKLSSLVDEVFTLLRKFINGEKGLTCEGLVHNYDYGIDSLDADFENLRLDLKSLNDEEVALRTRERYIVIITFAIQVIYLKSKCRNYSKQMQFTHTLRVCSYVCIYVIFVCLYKHIHKDEDIHIYNYIYTRTRLGFNKKLKLFMNCENQIDSQLLLIHNNFCESFNNVEKLKNCESIWF